MRNRPGTLPAGSSGFDRFDRNLKTRRFPGAVYVVPYGFDYFPGQYPTDQYPIDQYPIIPSYPYPVPESQPVEEEPPPAVGYVSLQLQTGANPQVFVDGSYVGTLDALGGQLTLDAGRHTIELWAEGYEPAVVDVEVPAYRTITYRGVLRPSSAAASGPQSAPAAQSAPSTAPIYFVPGCYVGNVPPTNLPADCKDSRVIRFAPRP